MKLLLFILGLTCHYIVSAQLGGWTLVTPQAYQADPNIKNLLEWGVNNFTAQEIAAGHLPAGTYTSQTINTIYSQVVNGVNYQYDTTVSNNLGWLLRATFVVNNVPATNTTSLVSYVYEILNNPLASIAEEEFIIFEEENLGGFSPVAISQLSTDTSLSDALNFGVQNVTAQAVADHRLPASEYEVIEVHSISEQVVAGLNDHFDVSVQNCAGLIARIAFTVYSPPGSTDAANGMQATLNSLGVTGIPIGGLIGGNCAGFNEEMNLEAALGEVDLSSAASAASSARLLQNGVAGGWSVVPLSEAQSDMDLQHALAFGVKQVTQMGIKSGQLPNQRYSSRLLSAQEQVVSGMNYKFVVALNGNRGARHRVMMEVYSQPWTGTLQLVSSMIM